MAKSTSVTLKELDVRNFSGGLNTRDAPSELAADEFVDSLNITIDERGGVEKRLGHERRFASAVGTGLVSNVFWWGSRGLLVSQIGTGMHVTNGAAFLNWSTSARCGMTEFAGNLVMVHPVDGVRVYDGTTVTGPFTNSPKGNAIATWQNKVWVAGDPTNPPRVAWSNAGTPSTWGVNDWVDLREKDSRLITCLSGASGLDVSGRPGLLAFKGESTYRIYDSSTGAYNTVDAQVGCGSNIGAVSAYGRTYAVSHRGVYYTDGINPMQEVTGKVVNFFSPDQINHSRIDLMAAGRRFDRVYFSVPRAGETANSLVLEIHPVAGWVCPHSNAASAYTMDADDLIFGSPSVNGMIYNHGVGGSDDGAAISSQFQTYWQEPNFGNLTRVRRVRVVGLGIFNVTLYKDYETGGSFASLPVSITNNAGIYDDAGSLYDSDDLYGPVAFQGYQDFYSIGVIRAFSLRIEETSTQTQQGREIIDGQQLPEGGAWRFNSMKIMTIPLGIR